MRPEPAAQPEPLAPEEAAEGRITLRSAEHQFGVRISTLRAWARRGSIDAVHVRGPRGDRWMVSPESVAHHLSRGGSRASRHPTQPADGTSMLVPRDAWDKLMDQLGNLHEAGQQLADARERAAKAETEATFLRERLAEMRSERDELKQTTASGPEQSPPRAATGLWSSMRDRIRRR